MKKIISSFIIGGLCASSSCFGMGTLGTYPVVSNSKEVKFPTFTNIKNIIKSVKEKPVVRKIRKKARKVKRAIKNDHKVQLALGVAASGALVYHFLGKDYNVADSTGFVISKSKKLLSANVILPVAVAGTAVAAIFGGKEIVNHFKDKDTVKIGSTRARPIDSCNEGEKGPKVFDDCSQLALECRTLLSRLRNNPDMILDTSVLKDRRERINSDLAKLQEITGEEYKKWLFDIEFCMNQIYQINDLRKISQDILNEIEEKTKRIENNSGSVSESVSQNADSSSDKNAAIISIRRRICIFRSEIDSLTEKIRSEEVDQSQKENLRGKLSDKIEMAEWYSNKIKELRSENGLTEEQKKLLDEFSENMKDIYATLKSILQKQEIISQIPSNNPINEKSTSGSQLVFPNNRMIEKKI